MKIDLDEQAYIRACELDSPNSPGFDSLRERIYEELSEKDVSIYTHKERTEKNYTVQDAINHAKVRFAGRVCLDSVAGLDKKEPITLERLNDLADSIVMDSATWK